jgi:hypothetical protein
MLGQYVGGDDGGLEGGELNFTIGLGFIVGLDSD